MVMVVPAVIGAMTGDPGWIPVQTGFLNPVGGITIDKALCEL